MPKWIFDLAWLSREMRLRPRTICECSVGPLDISIAMGFIGHRLLLTEPLPQLADAAEKALGAKVHRVAIGDAPGVTEFVANGGSSYIKGTWSPTPITDKPTIITVPVVTFDTLDDGEIDILNLDCEGHEWSVLKNMRSRPLLLAVELYDSHPFKNEITDWLQSNNYVLRFSTGPQSETLIYSIDPLRP